MRILMAVLNYILALPLCGLSGAAYFGHSEVKPFARFGYDAIRKTLDVHYVTGRSTYRYYDVPAWKALRLAGDPSGENFFALIHYAKHQRENLTWYPASVMKKLGLKPLKKNLKRQGVSPRQQRKRLRVFWAWLMNMRRQAAA